MKKLSIQNPYTLKKIKDVSYTSERALEQTVQNAYKIFPKYSLSSSFERAQWLKTAYEKLKNQKDLIAKTISEESGKPIQLAKIEVDRGLSVLDFGIAESLSPTSMELLPIDISSTQNKGFGIHKRFSKGVVLGICPFNFPLNLVLHKLVPSILTGSPILIKPSPFTPLTSLLLKKNIFDHLPAEAFQVILPEDRLMKKLTQDQRIAHISFTGSDKIGFLIQKDSYTPSLTLELGGNAWCIVSENMDEKNLPAIADKMIHAAFSYAGQSCISVQNIAIHKKHFGKLKKIILQKMETFPIGNPEEENTLCGPMIHKQAVHKIQKTLREKFSGKVIYQKFFENKHPHFFPLTLCEFPEIEKNKKILKDPLIQNELFAPIAHLHPYSSLQSVIQAIHGSSFGLQCGFFTTHFAEAYFLFENLKVGGLQINNPPSLRYDHQPYGGEKRSGLGREGIRYAIQEYTSSKFLGLSI